MRVKLFAPAVVALRGTALTLALSLWERGPRLTIERPWGCARAVLRRIRESPRLIEFRPEIVRLFTLTVSVTQGKHVIGAVPDGQGPPAVRIPGPKTYLRWVVCAPAGG